MKNHHLKLQKLNKYQISVKKYLPPNIKSISRFVFYNKSRNPLIKLINVKEQQCSVSKECLLSE